MNYTGKDIVFLGICSLALFGILQVVALVTTLPDWVHPTATVALSWLWVKPYNWLLSDANEYRRAWVISTIFALALYGIYKMLCHWLPLPFLVYPVSLFFLAEYCDRMYNWFRTNN